MRNLLTGLERSLGSRRALSGVEDANALIRFGEYLGLDNPGKLSSQKIDKQLSYIDSVIEAFFKKIGTSIPESNEDKIKNFLNFVRRFERNLGLISMFYYIKKYSK